MSDAFVNGFCLTLVGKVPERKMHIIRDALNSYIIGFDIKPITTSLTTTYYKLPNEYYIYMAAKTQDGKMRNGTKYQYASCLEKMLYRFGIPLNDYTTNHIRCYISEISVNAKSGKRLSNATINQRKAIIRSFFQWLYEEEYIEKDPSVRIKSDKSDCRIREPFEDTQIEAIRMACKDIRTLAIVNLLLSSGIRISECVNLNRQDVDFIKRSAIVYGKGGKWRTVYFNAATLTSLKAYLETRKDGEQPLFVSKRCPHDRLSTGAIRKILHSLQNESGVDDIIPHKLRHTMATEALNSGMPITSIQALLGHVKVDTTVRYAHTSATKAELDYKKHMR